MRCPECGRSRQPDEECEWCLTGADADPMEKYVDAGSAGSNVEPMTDPYKAAKHIKAAREALRRAGEKRAERNEP